MLSWGIYNVPGNLCFRNSTQRRQHYSLLRGEWIREDSLEKSVIWARHGRKISEIRAWAAESSEPGIKSQFYNLFAVWSWADDLPSLGSYKMKHLPLLPCAGVGLTLKEKLCGRCCPVVMTLHSDVTTMWLQRCEQERFSSEIPKQPCLRKQPALMERFQSSLAHQGLLGWLLSFKTSSWGWETHFFIWTHLHLSTTKSWWLPHRAPRIWRPF